jgi:hypothetical protein
VPDRDYFSCTEDEIADITSEFTMVGGRIVYGAGDFGHLSELEPPPAMPNWSPVRRYGGYGAWRDVQADTAAQCIATAVCGCDHRCTIHGHDHALAWSHNAPVSDLKDFWGVLGCACWAV